MIASFPLNKITSLKNETSLFQCMCDVFSGTPKRKQPKNPPKSGVKFPLPNEKKKRQGAELVRASAGLCGAGALELVEPPCEHRTPKLGPQGRRFQRRGVDGMGWMVIST